MAIRATTSSAFGTRLSDAAPQVKTGKIRVRFFPANPLADELDLPMADIFQANAWLNGLGRTPPQGVYSFDGRIAKIVGKSESAMQAFRQSVGDTSPCPRSEQVREERPRNVFAKPDKEHKSEFSEYAFS